MEPRTIAFVVIGILLIASLIWMITDIKQFSLPSYLCGMFICILLGLCTDRTHITIEKSSDSEWVKSDKDYPDTTITEVKIIKYQGKTDTVYPTIVYKRIKL